MARRGVNGLYRTGITRMAAALAYRTIFSLIPTLAIGLLIIGSVVSEDQVDASVRRLLGYAGISQIAVSEDFVHGPVIPDDDDDGMGPPTPGEAPPEEPAGEAGEGEEAPTEAEVAYAATEVEEIITGLISRVNTTLRNLPMGWIALVTGVVLFYAALSMLIEVEKSFNQVCGAPAARSWTHRLVLYWAMLSLGGLLLPATFWAGDSLASWVRGGGGSTVRGLLAGYGVSVLISTLLLTVAYAAIPTVRLKFRSVLVGAFAAAIAWELGKWGFTSYLRFSTGYARLYGSLALLPLFLLWVYVTWVIVLLGLQAAYTLQNYTRLMAMRDEGDQAGPQIVDPAMAVAVTGALVRAHDAGQTPKLGDLAERLGFDATVIEIMLRRLERAGLVRRVVGDDDEQAGWLPARPAELLGVGEVLDAVEDLDASRATTECVDTLCGLTQARRARAEGMTMADAVPAPHRAGRPGGDGPAGA